MTSQDIQVVTIHCGGRELEFPGRYGEGGPSVCTVSNAENRKSPCKIYQEELERTKRPIIIYAHNDLTIHDPSWLVQVMDLFVNEDATIVGLGGALALGSKDLYRKPYNIWNLARRGYCSNQMDAEVHGTRETEVRRVAVVEQFFMALRTDWLRARGGWPVQNLTHHMMDGWLACEAARSQAKTFMVGVSCTHHGGGSSTTDSYAKAPWLIGGTRESDHQLPHRWLWESYRDVLPVEISQ